MERAWPASRVRLGTLPWEVRLPSVMFAWTFRSCPALSVSDAPPFEPPTDVVPWARLIACFTVRSCEVAMLIETAPFWLAA